MRNLEIQIYRSWIKIPVAFFLPALSLITLYVVIYFVLNSSTGVDIGEKIASKSLLANFEVNRMLVNPSFNRVHIFGAKIYDAENKELIEVEDADVYINPLLLLVNRLHISKAILIHPRYIQRYDAQHRLNITRAFSTGSEASGESSGKSTFRFSLENTQLIEGYTRLEFGFMTIIVEGINAKKVELSTGDELSIDVPKLTAKHGNIRFKSTLFGFSKDHPDLDLFISYFRILQWHWRKDGFFFTYLKFLINGMTSELYGRMNFPSDEDNFSYSGAGNILVKQWAPIAHYFMGDSVKADAKIAAAVDGDAYSIRAHAAIDAPLLQIAGVTTSNFRGDVDLIDSLLLLNNGELKLHDGSIKFDTSFFDIFKSMYGSQFTFKNLNPYTILNEISEQPSWLNGRASGKLRISGELPDNPWRYPFSLYNIAKAYDSHLLNIEFLRSLRFARLNQEVLPGSYFDLTRGSKINLNSDKIEIPKATIRADSGTFKVQNFGFDWNHFSFEPLNPKAGPAVINASGENIANLTKHYNFNKIEGKYNATIKVKGRANYPELQLDAKVSDPKITGAESIGKINELSTSMTLKNGVVKISKGTFSSDSGNATVKGTIAILNNPENNKDPKNGKPTTKFLVDKNPNLSIDYDVSNLDLSVVSGFTGLPMSGKATASGTIKNRIKNPTVKLDTDVKNLTIAGQPIENFGANVSLKNGALSFNHFTLNDADGGKLKLNGEVAVRPGSFTPTKMNLAVDATNLKLENLKQLKTQPVKGNINAHINLLGTPSKPIVNGSLTADNLSYSDFELGNLVVVLNTIDQIVYLTGGLLPWFSVQAEYPLEEDDPIYARLAFANFDITKFVPDIIDSKLVNHFSATGDLEFFADKKFSDYQIVGTVSSLQFDTLNHSFQQSGDIIVGYNSDNVLQIQKLTLKSDDRELNVVGALSLDDKLVDLKLDGTVELALLNRAQTLFPSFFPDTLRKFDGETSMNIQLRGVPRNLSLDGYFAFNNARIYTRAFPDPILIRSGNVEFQPGRVFVQEDHALTGNALTGSYSVYGNIDLDGFTPKSINLFAKTYNISYQLPDTLQLTLDSDLAFSAEDFNDATTWKLSGDVEIISGAYYQKVSLLRRALTDPLLGAIDRTTQRYQAGLFDTVPQLKDMKLDLTVRARDGLRLRNSIDKLLLDLELRANLDIENTLADPEVTGAVEVLNGTVNLQNEDFAIRTGTVTFFGDPYNPILDIQAAADIRNRCAQGYSYTEQFSSLQLKGLIRNDQHQIYRIGLYLQGSLDKLDFNFNSNPAADKRDILSLLLTGCTIDQLATSDNSSQQTLEIALGPLLNWIENRVQTAIQIDEFTISPSVDRLMAIIGDSYSPRLSWRLFLDTGFNNFDSGQRAQVKYLLSNDWSIEASEHARTEQGTPAIDLKFIFTRDFD